jgi:hypothetical protein
MDSIMQQLDSGKIAVCTNLRSFVNGIFKLLNTIILGW